MSELIDKTECWTTFQCRLLATVSATALLGIAVSSEAAAADAGEPTVWVEIGGQFDQLRNQQEIWVPDFTSTPHASPLVGGFQNLQKLPTTSVDASAELSFRPNDGDWIFSVSARFGKTQRRKEASKTDHILPVYYGTTPSHYGIRVYSTESHGVIDFQVGKDVGIGLSGATSTVSLGLRFASLRSRSNVEIGTKFPFTFYGSATNQVTGVISRKFHGIGPSIGWNGSIPILGDIENGQLGVDIGANAAVLFGRQTTTQSTDGAYRQRSYDWSNFVYVSHTQSVHSESVRRRNATVPNLGGFVAATYRFPNVKVSLGYRADWYFNAMDGGVATPRNENRGFFGPYLNIGIGLGG